MTNPSTASRTTNNPSTTVIHAAASAKPRANGDKTSHTPNKKLATSCQCRMRMTLTSLPFIHMGVHSGRRIGRVCGSPYTERDGRDGWHHEPDARDAATIGMNRAAG